MVLRRLFGRKSPKLLPSGPAGDAPPPPAPNPVSVPPPRAGVRSAAGSRRVRVFVSSTFRDMTAERDELMSQVWPELRRFCRERQVEFVEVDMRWGISEEQATRKETLKLCLGEIHACRPYFVGLLGERYGWVPEGEAFTDDLEEEQPWVKELRGCSVTELEIQHGVLNDPEMAGRAYFYFRDPGYAAGRGPDFLAETPEAAARQAALKERIRAVCRERGIPLREGYPDPRALGGLVQEDLRAAIDAEHPLESIPDPLEREAREHEAYADVRRRVYIGRPDYGEALDSHARGTGGPLVVVGESGSGKSALLANWLQDWQGSHPGDFVFQHYIGGTPGSASHWGLLSRLLAEIKRWTGDPAELPVSHDDILRELPTWLARLHASAENRGVRAVVVLDSLDRIEEHDGGQRLGWLPDGPFAGSLRLITSTLPGEAQEAVERRGWLTLHVEPLTLPERRQFIAAYLGRFGKQLDLRRLGRLAAAPSAANPLYLKLLLDELRVTGTHERLDERLASYLSVSDIPALLDKILARCEQAYERDRPGLVGEALSLVWAARRGLSEPELLALLRPPGLPQLPAAVWAPLRSTLDESLVDHGGILGFAHDFLRSAVQRRYAAGAGRQRALRLRLAGYFEEQPATARACDEQPWLLWQAGEHDRLQACLLDLDRFLMIRHRDKQEVLSYWHWLGEVEGMGARYQAAFESWQHRAGAAPAPARVALMANHIGLLLVDSGQYGLAEPFHRRALALWQKLWGERHPETATALNNLGQLRLSMGDLQAARPYLERSLAIRQQVLGERHAVTASSLNNLGLLLEKLGDLTEARRNLEQALAVWRGTRGERHPDTATGLNNLGVLLRAMGDLKGARLCLEQALSVRSELLGWRHPETASTLASLGVLLRDLGDLTEAKTCCERALAILQELLGERHPDVAVIADNLGQLLADSGDLAGARLYFERALAIRQQALGEHHPDTAQSLNNLGTLFYAMGDLARARSCLEQALAIRREQLGEHHLEVVTTCGNLGMLLRASGDLAGARPYLERVVAIQLEEMGEHHSGTAQSLNNLALLCEDMGDLAGARRHLERAVAIWQAVLGERHPETATGLNNLGLLLLSMGDSAKARPYLERALTIRREMLGERHPATAQSLNNLGFLLLETSQPARARPYLEQALAISREVLGERHPEVATTLNNLGVLLQSLGDLQVARSYFERALATRQEVLGERHPDTASSFGNLGFLLLVTGDLAAARPCLERALAIRQDVLGERHLDTAKSLNRLGILLTAMGDQPGARRCFERALAVFEALLGPHDARTRTVRQNLASV